jgi:uncharacterized membrane protein
MTLLRTASLAGLLLSGWLLFQKLTGKITYLVGCGSGSGCENVLGSRWSQWLHVPVTALSLALYVTLLALTFRPHRPAALALGAMLAGAAIWFALVQAFILRAFCPWCLAAHAVGLFCAVLIFRAGERGERRIGPLAAGMAALAMLITGQIFGPAPATHAETHATLEATAPAPGKPLPVHERGEGRLVSFLGNKKYRIASLPHLGDPAAPHVLVKYFDYTCDSCRDLHEDLEAVMAKHPGKFCIVVLPCPIQRACNPHVPAHLADHAHACDLARLALACWRTEPARFAAVHHALFAQPAPAPANARATVAGLLSRPLADAALHDPWIDEMLAADAADYQRVNVTNSGQTNYLMPKLLVGGTRMLHGVTQSREILFQALEREFKLTPP